MSNKLYVVNLNFSITSAELIALFSSAGKVRIATIVRDKDTDRPRGFGFVMMEDEAGKLEAIKMFDGILLKGRVIKVSEAVDRYQRVTRPRIRMIGKGTCAICETYTELAGFDNEHGICAACAKIIGNVHYHSHKCTESADEAVFECK